MKTILENLQGLGWMRLMLLGGVGAAIVAGIVAMSLMMSQASTTPLYSGPERGEAARMGQVLREMGINFDVQQDGTALLVDPEDAPRARMTLAERGLPASSGTGYELFDDQGTLGLTSFMQKVTRTRAMEGELARTIQTMDAVKAARVHLVLPDREAFSRNAPTPSASVIVRTVGGERLATDSATAIQHLVAAAVPNLSAGDVTVLDTSGEILAAEGDANSARNARLNDIKAEIEGRMKLAVEELLSPYLGLGNYRVMVTADVNLDREVVSEETFDPDSRVTRSQRNMSENETSTDTSFEPPVTVEQNLPAEDLANGPGNSSSAETQRNEETINYEISSVKRERVSEGGDIERLSVAVLVNGVTSGSAAGETTYEARSPEELQRIAGIVRTAIGFDESRGDVVTVESVPFLDRSLDIEAVGQPGWSEVLFRNLGTLVQSAVLLVIVALLTLFGLRPLIARLLPQRRQDADQAPAAAAVQRAEEGAESQVEATVRAEMTGVSGAEGEALPSPEAGDDGVRRLGRASNMDRLVDDMIELKAVEGRVRESSVAKLGDIVDDYPEEAVGILRAWLYEGRPA